MNCGKEDKDSKEAERDEAISLPQLTSVLAVLANIMFLSYLAEPEQANNFLST